MVYTVCSPYPRRLRTLPGNHSRSDLKDCFLLSNVDQGEAELTTSHTLVQCLTNGTLFSKRNNTLGPFYSLQIECLATTLISLVCNSCRQAIVTLQVVSNAKGAVTCNLSRKAIARQVAQIIAQCNIPYNGQKRCETSFRNRCRK